VEPSVFRISAVLAGQSAHVTVVGRDAAGRELQLELPPAQARALEVGQLLLLSWSAHAIPELDSGAPAGSSTTAEPTAEATAASTAEPATSPPGDMTTRPGESPDACGCDEDEVFRMLGLG
jgi:hypothetical protein